MRIRTILLGIVGLAFLLGHVPASADPVTYTIYTSETAFLNALTDPQSSVDFESSSPGYISGSEFSGQGFIFHSPLTGSRGQLEIAPPPTSAPLFYPPSTPLFYSSNYLNIGERPWMSGDGTEDSLDISIQGNWKAVGFLIVDSSIPYGSNESITVYDQSGNIIYTRLPSDGHVNYFGIIADVPIGKISISEALNDEDDAGYDNFRLGNQAVHTPEPGTLLLVGSALIGLIGLRKKFQIY
jgi:PEP-CTERM motif